MTLISTELPTSSFPKPGEEVTWFARNRKIDGKLIGYDPDEKPVIINEFGNPATTDSFDIIRPKYPNRRLGPNWDRIPEHGIITKADIELQHVINEKLKERIPPGPSYLELIAEMYYRGYETYLVGGTIRDFLQGEHSNDVDLVTTMPLKSAQPLIKSMFNSSFSYNKKRGYIRIGGSPASGDPFIDVKNFAHSDSSMFGCEFDDDYRMRDFACNAVYYDPINNNLLDPSGKGISDAKSKKLSLVKDHNIHHPYFSTAQILIRFVKFTIRGYVADEETMEIIRSVYCPLFSTMTTAARMQYIKSQILNKLPRGGATTGYTAFVTKMSEHGFEEIYVKYILPNESLLKLES